MSLTGATIPVESGPKMNGKKGLTPKMQKWSLTTKCKDMLLGGSYQDNFYRNRKNVLLYVSFVYCPVSEV